MCLQRNIFLSLMAFLLFVSCSSEAEPEDSKDETKGPITEADPKDEADPVSFQKDIYPDLVASCSKCHEGAGAPAGLSIPRGNAKAAYESLTAHRISGAGPKERYKECSSAFGSIDFLIVKGDSEKSPFLARLVGSGVKCSEIGMMPPSGNAPAPDDLTEKIVKWIDEGARDN